MKSFSKKFISTFLAVLMTVLLVVPSFAAEQVDYKITNPYETVDWDTWNTYKAQLHAHTIYSDGEMDITSVVEAYYALDYDILAITDHGVVNQGWDKVPEMIDFIGYNQYIRKIEPLDAKRYAEITAGVGRDGRGMLDVPMGIEMNALVVRKNHVNGFFCGYGQSILGTEEDYESVVAGTEAAGGISFINHPGDFYGAAGDIKKAQDPENLRDWANIYMKYKSCVGLEVFNEDDTISKHDRVIWDNLLMYTIPRGRNIWAFGNDDSHWEDHIGHTTNMMLMPANTVEDLRTAMENGTLFVCSKNAEYEIDPEFHGDGNYATVHRITIDEENDIISADITSDSDYTVEWVADGEVIATGDSINLRDYSEQIGSYVRFQIKNAGGILLSQPFVCDDGNMEACMIYYPEEKSFTSPILQFIYEMYLFLRRTIVGAFIYDEFFL